MLPIYRKVSYNNNNNNNNLSRARRRMSFTAGAEFTWSKDIIYHDNAGADGGDKIMEGIQRMGPR